MINDAVLFFAAAPQPGGQGAQAEQGPGFWIGWFGLMLAIFYFIMIRPQQRKEKERQHLLSNIKNGDKVVFSGGIIGTVANTKENTFMIRIAEKVKIEVARGAVTQVLGKGDEPEEKPA